MAVPRKLLAELIALPSVNPALLVPGHPWSGERRVAEYLAAVLGQTGLDIRLEPVTPERPLLLASCRPSGRVRQRVVLAPHLDTVGSGDLSGQCFKPRIHQGRLYGRGACDAKGSATAMVSALLDLARQGRRPAQTEIVFAGLIDEEYNQQGSRFLVERGFRAALAVVGEPTRLRVVTAHKGDLWLRLECRGRPAHGAQPKRGHNAIHTMARVVEVLETDYARQLARKNHPLLGPATVNVGTISGGVQPNIVPGYCTITIDRRTLPGETETSVRRDIRHLLARQGLHCRCVNTKSVACLSMQTDPQLPLVRKLMRAARQHKSQGVDFFCDAAVLTGGGIPSVVFGPGDIAQAHTDTEWISLASLERATGILEAFLRSLP